LTSLAVNPQSISIAATTATSFTAMGTYADGSTQNITSSVTWTSSAPTVGSISNTIPTKGTVLGLMAGTTTIQAASGTISGTATLTVTSATLTSIVVTPANSSIPLGVLQQFKAVGTFSDSTAQDITNTVTWASSANGIASITVSGLANGGSVGTVTISATSGSVSGSTSLTVNLANLASLAITPVNPTVAKNTSLKLVATGTFNDGGTRNLTTLVTWSSSDPAKATVGASNGLAKGVAPGTTTITATLGPVNTTATLTVTNATVMSITVTPANKTIAPGTKQNFNATGTFSDGTTQFITSDVVWASDNTSFATITAAGSATGVSAGTANISASLGGVTGSAPLTVSGATLVSLAVTPTSTVLAPASTLLYQAIGTYSDGSTQAISNSVAWSSSDTKVVTIQGSGQATGQSAGVATIQAQLGSISSTANIVVESSALQSITVIPATSSIPVQVELQYTAMATFADGSTQNLTNSVTWTSSAPAIATVSVTAGSQGLATGVSPGTSTVTATFGGVVGSATLTVSNATLTSITVTPSSASIALGTSQQFTATGNYSDGPHDLTNQATWTSSDVHTAVVNGTGLAISAASGTTTIEAAMGSVTPGSAVLTVQ
jgi:trimeric autotransporter adhesin